MHRSFRTTAALALLILGSTFVASSAMAQDAAKPDGGAENAPATIIVTGEGLEEPLSSLAYEAHYLEREQLISTGSGRIEDALSSIAGFQQFRRSDWTCNGFAPVTDLIKPPWLRMRAG